MNPSVPGYGAGEFSRAGVVDLHRLYVGQTMCVVGAIFVAAGIRPR